MRLNVHFNYQTIKLPDDYEGKVVATLLSSKENCNNRKAVLHVHGFVDYFFHHHVAKRFLEKGYDFYALELRKYGHSLLPHQHPNYCRTIEEYYSELSIAIEAVCNITAQKVVLLGHSTGGLIAAHYLNQGPKRHMVDALILNSPFLEFNITPFAKQLLTPLSKLVTRYRPFAKSLRRLNPTYVKSLHSDYHGEWAFNLSMKPLNGFPVYYAWLLAIKDAQEFLRWCSDIKVPILVFHSSKSIIPRDFTPEAHVTDVVLNVVHIKELSRNLGASVTIKEVKNAVHDVFLSKPEVRSGVYTEMFDWLNLHFNYAESLLESEPTLE